MDDLNDKHYDMLAHASSIDDQIIAMRGYKTVSDNDILSELGFSSPQRRAPGLLIPVWTTDGTVGLYQFRPDSPRVEERKNGHRNPDGSWPQREIKYETPRGASMRLDCPPSCRPFLGDPSRPLWITEGVKKVDALASRGLVTVGLLGVFNWRGRNDMNGLVALPDWELVALNGRQVRIVFDSDVMTNPDVKTALDRLTRFLQMKGAQVELVYLPGGRDHKVGVDDYFAAGHTVQELEDLITGPREQPKPAPDLVELLDQAPAMITRPLSLLDGAAYAATWLFASITKKEELNPKGEIIRFNPPIKTSERRLFIIRGDGIVFGVGGDKTLEDLGLEIHLTEMPRDDRLWSTRGVKAYREGRRPDPVAVFRQVAQAVDRFVDFDHSLSGQQTMSDLVALFVLASWLLDGFTVAPYLWANGERGTGKSQLLLVASSLGYLGEFITTGGSLASLRDLSDYGAGLCFDDAESMTTKNFDPDKRAIMLSGSRRGSSVTLKELAPDGKRWITRNVNTFCPRAFSAIRLPDPVLSSRTIIVPLIRSSDRKKTNIDPTNSSDWPFNVQELIDNLWALGLAYLPEMPKWDRWVGDNASLTGRNLQPWRPILAVAAWLDSLGASDLWTRMNNLSVHYHEVDRRELEIPDLAGVVVRALVDGFKKASFGDGWDSRDVRDSTTESTTVETKSITDRAVTIIEADELDFEKERVTTPRVGRILSKLRLEKSGHVGKARSWILSRKDVLRLVDVYGLGETNAPLIEGEEKKEDKSWSSGEL